MMLNNKFNCVLNLCCLEKKNKKKVELSFTKNYFLINFIEPLSKEYIKEIKELIPPLFTIKDHIIRINYVYIKNLYTNNTSLIKITLHNPIKSNIFTIIFSHLQLKKVLPFFFPVYKRHSLSLPSVTLKVDEKISSYTIHKINSFLDFIHLLYRFINTERKYNKIIENFAKRAFNIGIVYYRKNLKEFNNSRKKNTKLLSSEISSKINNYIAQLRFKKESENKINMMEQIQKVKKNSSSIRESVCDEKSKAQKINAVDELVFKNKEENLEYNHSIYLALEIDSNNRKDLFENYEIFKKVGQELKIKSSYYAEITVNLIYKMLNIDKVELDNKFNCMNRSFIGMQLNMGQINSTIFATVQHPSNFNLTYNYENDIPNANMDFENININMEKTKNDENNSYQNTEEFINELLNFSQKFNSFVPNNNIQNIEDNAAQLINRKFFELLLKHFFPDIIDVSIDKNRVMELDTFHQSLRILRRLKQILFVNKNKKYFEEFISSLYVI